MRILLSAWLILLLTNASYGADVTPDKDCCFSSMRSITSISVMPDGKLIVSARGGSLVRNTDGGWRRYDGETCIAPPALMWRGNEYRASIAGLQVKKGDSWQDLGMPKSSGTHISAIMVKDDHLLVAMYGDGLYVFNGKSWMRSAIALPEHARQVTAIASYGNILWVGTLSDGVWEYDGKHWSRHIEPDEPADTNCQYIFSYSGNIYISTLDHGLVVRTANGWQNITSPQLSSNWPRQMVGYKGSLYVLHGSGIVDRFDGKNWHRNDLANLPRKQVTALAADTDHLYAGQWGGWSVLSEEKWTHYLDKRDLQGESITALLPDGNKLWIGTQRRGLAEYSSVTKEMKWHDERAGLTDDWIKQISKIGGIIYVSTFTGGLACYDAKTWTVVPETRDAEITALEPGGSNEVWFAARKGGLWRRAADGGTLPLTNAMLPRSLEAQALFKVAGGLWVGTRNAIYFLRY